MAMQQLDCGEVLKNCYCWIFFSQVPVPENDGRNVSIKFSLRLLDWHNTSTQTNPYNGRAGLILPLGSGYSCLEFHGTRMRPLVDLLIPIHAKEHLLVRVSCRWKWQVHIASLGFRVGRIGLLTSCKETKIDCLNIDFFRGPESSVFSETQRYNLATANIFHCVGSQDQYSVRSRIGWFPTTLCIKHGGWLHSKPLIGLPTFSE